MARRGSSRPYASITLTAISRWLNSREILACLPPLLKVRSLI